MACLRNLASGYFSILAAKLWLSEGSLNREDVYSQKGGEIAREVKLGEDAMRRTVKAWPMKVDLPW